MTEQRDLRGGGPRAVMRLRLVVLLSALVAIAAPGAAGAATGRIDFAGDAYNVLPPGESGGLPAVGTSTDQIALYDGLTPKRGQVTAQDLRTYFKSERFGVQGRVVRRERTGRRGLRILRDRFDVPHVYGRTRRDVMFGAGWVAMEDRGLLMEQARGAARVAAVGVPGLDAFGLLTSLRTFVPSPQTEAFLHRQVRVLTRMGAKGRLVLRDYRDWLAGINAYARRRIAASSRPRPWTMNDAIAAFAFIGSIFGNGGGDEVRNSDLLASLQAHLGAADGLAVFRDLRQVDDPEAPVSIPGRFANLAVPSGPTPGSPVIDADSIVAQPAAPGLARAASPPRLASNALLVGASHSATGHPLAVMGPQIGYFYPQLVMEADLHGGGIDARGAAPPVSPYILIGRGKDYAWSLTSANNDNTDQFLEQLCNADGSPPTRASTSYMYRGRCRPMSTFTAGVLKGTAGAPDQTIAFRQTVHGPVGATVTVGGRPYAVATMRATRGREPASAVALADLNANKVRSPRSFFDVANEFETTFNWHYLDSRNIAFFSSGRLPIRARGVDPSLPTLGTGRYDWRGFLGKDRHPHAVNPRSGLILNWNNKQARGWGAADNHWSEGSVHRVQAFTGFKARNTLADVVGVMNRAATQDLRATLVWPVVARVLAGGPAPTPLAQRAVDLVAAWIRNGASRLDETGDGKVTDPGAAVMDAAWSGVADAAMSPVLGPVLPKFARINPEDDPANPTEGTYFSHGGWYGYLSKDLRSELGEPVKGPFSRRYCGGGDLAACRASLWAAVQAAVDRLSAAQGPDPAAWRADANAERLVFQPGLIPDTMRWTNRPAFQQAISFVAHR